MKSKLHWIAAALAFAAMGAHAQQAGSFMARIGATNINPDVRSDDLTAPSLPGTKADVNDNTQLSGGLTYMWTDHLAIDLPLALPFKHDIVGAGAIAGAGKIADVKALPVTLLAQWRFLDANAKFRPYIGGGITYAKFYKEHGTATLSALTGGAPTTLKVDAKLVPTIAAGIVFNVTDKIFVEADVHKTFLKTTAHLSTGQDLRMKLDPLSTSIAVGMRFR